MHSDLSAHLHSAECNELIAALKKCHTDNKFGRFIGWCNEANTLMLRCLKQERLKRQEGNLVKAREQQKKVRETILEDDD